MSKPILIVTIGISGSGKSHLKDRLESYFGNKFLNVEPDDIRRSILGNVNDQSQGARIFSEAGQLVSMGYTKEKITYFNATNTNWKNLKNFVNSNWNGDNVLYIVMMDSLRPDLCKERIKKDLEDDKDRSRVPDEVIDRQLQQFRSCKENIMKEHLNVICYDGGWNDATGIIQKIEEMI